MSWYPHDGGSSIGRPGSEGGVIVVDDEHPGGARITLERGGTAPWSITCGVQGAMVHTRFFGDEASAEAALGSMKADLESLLVDEDEGRFAAFVERYP